MSRTCSGVLRMSTEVMMELMHDDFPAPVAPDMRMWGISAKLAMTARPAMSRPMATSSDSVIYVWRNSGDARAMARAYEDDLRRKLLAARARRDAGLKKPGVCFRVSFRR